MPPPPPLYPLHARSPLSPRVLIIASGMAAGAHRIFNEILVREQNADLTIASHLAIAEDSAILAVDVSVPGSFAVALRRRWLRGLVSGLPARVSRRMLRARRGERVREGIEVSCSVFTGRLRKVPNKELEAALPDLFFFLCYSARTSQEGRLPLLLH